MNNANHENNCVLSIIIPVYNVEEYVLNCLESVTACNLEKCEIIISLGESKDQSNQICEDFVLTCSYAKIVKQTGTGLSNARNCAMRQACGKYMMFIDSDDCVDTEQLNLIIQKLRTQEYDSDVVVTDYRYFDCRFNVWRKVYQIGENTKDQHSIDFLSVMLRERGGFWNVWRYIYRRAFLEEHEITFWENMMSEDMDFTARVFLANPKIVFTHSPYYLYTIGRGNSLMDRPNLKRCLDTEKIIRVSCESLRSSSFLYAPLIRDRYQYEYFLLLAQIVQLEPKERKVFIKAFRDWKNVLYDSTDTFVKYGCILLRICGIVIVGYILNVLKLIHHWKLERSLSK